MDKLRKPPPQSGGGFYVIIISMADPIQQKDENIITRTMKGDFQKLSGAFKETIKKTEPIPTPSVSNISQEAKAAAAPIFESAVLPAQRPVEPRPISPVDRPPVLTVPPKTIPLKKTPEILAKPLFKATPVWLKISGIGLGLLLIVIAGLYGYWKIFIQSQPTIEAPKVATTPLSTFPIAPIATTTASVKFFNKLPNKEVTIDISSKTSDILIKSLKSEAVIKEALASVKQVKITFQGKPITAGEFFNLMSIFTPKDFFSNYEDEFAFAFFSQKEGARPILIIKTKNRESAENQMKNWETGTLSSDIFPLFLTNFKLPKYLPTFKNYLFIGQPVHYLNISLPFASLNYAIYNNFLIFTTSSAGMFVVLQDLTGQKVSFNYLKSLEASIDNFVK